MTLPRPSRDGYAAMALTGAMLLVAAWSGNNLIVLLGAVGVATLLVSAVVAVWNLVGIDVVRVLPTELYAGQEGRGRYIVRNRRRLMAAVGLRIDESGSAGSQPGTKATGEGADVRIVSTQGEATCTSGWTLPERGVVALRDVRVSSVFPFGLWTVERTIERPAEILVFPSPGAGRPRLERGDLGAGEGARRGDDPGDFAGLRPYRAGDPPRSIHWRTSARAGVPIVVERAGFGVDHVIVRVQPRPGPAFERELARACGEVLRAFALGVAVGLELPDEHHEPRPGPGWRRTLLGALAIAPRRSP